MQQVVIGGIYRPWPSGKTVALPAVARGVASRLLLLLHKGKGHCFFLSFSGLRTYSAAIFIKAEERWQC